MLLAAEYATPAGFRMRAYQQQALSQAAPTACLPSVLHKDTESASVHTKRDTPRSWH